MKKNILLLTLFIILIFAACSKKVVPTTYAVNVLPLIQMKCAPCHVPSKGGNKTNFENFVIAQKFGAEMVSRIERNPGEKGFMPFRQPAKLTIEEIAIFKKWISDGFLEK